MAKRALVTGGAGLIGSHVVDLLVNDGWEVRALDNLEPQTHRRGKPAWINKKAEFVHGDLRDRNTIAAALDAGDADVDWTLNDGVLTIDCGTGGKIIVNRHQPSREIWVAAKSGGFHFRGQGGKWRDTRDETELGAALSQLLRAQAGIDVELTDLPAPD